MTILSARLLRGRKIRCNPRCVRRVCCGKDRQDCGRRAARSAAPIGAGLFRIASNSQPGQPSLVLSGVHATIAGVILGLVAPLRPKSPPEQLADNAQPLLKNFRSQILSNDKSSAEATLAELDLLVRATDSIAERLERGIHPGIHPWVCFQVLPLFALASAGVALSAAQLNLAISSPIALGVFLGLILGKVLLNRLILFSSCALENC
ncbi:MAG: hypothetical protein DMG41_27710 [Acidobacteria bacterium]|nr:MAG: hypothetical protein DMG42_36960 [Acidobacteriota bacterium]PYT84374.1 MAG: hypothetical protein DMG41_27710 [Acidobacteriota bacterium]